MTKKRVLISALCVCIAAIIACGSLAYFTGSKSVTNEFMVAGYEPGQPTNPDDMFSISIYETDITKTDGSVTNTGNTYEGIAPGDVFVKDPTVKNTGEYNQFVRVNVTVSKAKEWATILPAGSDLTSIFGGLDSSKWTLANLNPAIDEDTNTITYSYYFGTYDKGTGKYTGTELAKDQTATLFTSVTIPSSLTTDQFANISDFTVTITADAIQTKNVGSIDEAFVIYDGLKK